MHFQSVSRAVASYCARQPFVVGLYFRSCVGGEEFMYRGDAACAAASVRKIAILMAALHAVHVGKLSLDQRVTIAARFQKNRSGPVRFMRPGSTMTLRDALLLMIIVSDCTCTAHIVDLLGVDAVNAYCASVGMRHTKITGGFPPTGKEHLRKYRDTTSPSDMGRLLHSLLQGTTNTAAAKRLGCTTALCRLALEILGEQELNTRLPFLLPSEATVAHKTGTRRGVANDAGIIFVRGKPRFILCVFTENADRALDPSVANLFIAKLCRKYYDAIARDDM